MSTYSMHLLRLLNICKLVMAMEGGGVSGGGGNLHKIKLLDGKLTT